MGVEGVLTPPKKMYEGSEYVLTPNITFFHSKLLLDNSPKFHVMKDERLVSKMDGKTNFFEAPETV